MVGPLIDVIVVLGIGVVLPLALGHARMWVAVAAAVAVSLVLPIGPIAVVLAATWIVVGVGGLVGALRAAMTARVAPALLADVVAPAYACVAGVAIVCSRGDVALFGIGEPIVELTAVHFTYAGVGAVALAGVVAGRHRVAGAVAVVVTSVAPPIVAVGFVLEHPVPQVGGAVLMASGVLLIAGLQLSDAGHGTGASRSLLVVSGLAPWIPMVLAVAWAASLYVDVPALGIPDMVRVHGTMNAVFVIAGLAARRLRGELGVGAGGGRSEPVDPPGR